MLDGQHITLLGLCQKASLCLDGRSADTAVEVRDILEELIRYTETHFREEENLLRACAYPGFEAHRDEHRAYSMRLTEFLLDAGNGIVDREALFEYLTEWWGRHILGSDKAYVPYLQNPPAVSP